jgi:hypothetical protein
MTAAASHMRPPRPAFKTGGGIIVALCLATSAHAQDRATYCNGLGNASVAPTDEGYAVSVVNAYCPNNGWSDLLDVVTLEIDGLRILVQVFSAPGLTPDDIVVIPPAGWMADPARLTVEEHETGVIRLFPVALS